MVTDNKFILTAIIASHIDDAMHVARKLAITASNARALAFRAGNSAMGFRPLTDYINRLANLTASSSARINHLACDLSRIATEREKTDQALRYFAHVYDRAADSPNLCSLYTVYAHTAQRGESLKEDYRAQINLLKTELETLAGELRAAVMLVTMSRVEALQAEPVHQKALNNVADNVEEVTAEIRQRIDSAKQLVSELKRQFS